MGEWHTPNSPQITMPCLPHTTVVTAGIILFMPTVEGCGRKVLMMLRVPPMAGAIFSTSFSQWLRNPFLRLRMRLRHIVTYFNCVQAAGGYNIHMLWQNESC
jgi:hypothetical protein